MAIMKKILFRVDRCGDLEWVHFCYVPAEVRDRFFAVTKMTNDELKHCVEHWLYEDYKAIVKINTYDDVDKARQVIKQRFHTEYSELYIMGDGGGNPSVFGIVRMWLVQHMRVEIAKYELSGEVK